MKFEKEYNKCVDYIFNGIEKHEDSDPYDILKDVEDVMEASINRNVAELEMKNLLDSWHERKIMTPR